VKYLLIILSFLLFSSPHFEQSSKYETVIKSVLETIKEKKLSGNAMYVLVKEECEERFL